MTSPKHFTRPLVSLDLESTGVDPVLDRIIEFGCTVLSPDGTRRHWEQRFNPGMPIPAEATAVHGITDADVVDKPPFGDYAAKILAGLRGRDIVGYNLWRMDLPMIDEELRRCGLRLDLTGVNVIDAFGIFSNREPRDLSAAVKRYCGRSHEDAHGAAADAAATLDVLCGQLAEYEDLRSMDLSALSLASLRGDNQPADLAGKLYRKNGDLYYAFGKVKDMRVADDPGFGRWMLRQSTPPFPGSTREVLMAEFERLEL